MKAMPSGLTVERLVELLRQGRLLPAEELKMLAGRWRQEAKDPADVARFIRWLVRRGQLTQFQLAILLHGHVENFVLGAFKLRERIGKGTLAVVYKADDWEGRTVAIKVFLPSKVGDPDLTARFRNEADFACQLNHPNVVRALQAGEAEGVHFLVLEHLQGENLRELLEHRRQLAPVEVVHVARQTLQGLQYLFEQGFVHRNLEPSNLMLAYPPVEQRTVDSVLSATVKILDMSLSRSLFEETLAGSAGRPRRTAEEPTLGAPAYLAPEQARDARSCDIRADLYSLGCILYHALAGEPPFRDPSPVGLAVRHATERPRPLREICPGLPLALESVIARLMAKEPGERFATPAEAAAALARKISEPVAAPGSRIGSQASAVLTGAAPSPSAAPDLPMPPTRSAEAEPEFIEMEPVPVAPPVGAGTRPEAGPRAAEAEAMSWPPLETAAPDRFTSDLTGSSDDLSLIPPSPRLEERLEAGPRSRGRMALYLLLGGLGLLAAELLGWLLAQLLHALALQGNG